MNEIHTIQLTNKELERLKEILSKTYKQEINNWDFGRVKSTKLLMEKLDNDKDKK